MGTISSTGEKYLEAIYCISFEGEVVRPGHLATWLSVSPPSVSDAIQRLQRDGWIHVRDDRSIELSPEGLGVASNLIRRHRILERWLTDGLGLDWASADEEAERLSTSMSDQLIDRIDASMGRPLTCPHGNLVPGREAPYGELTALANVQSGIPVVVRRISEVAEHEARDFLTRLSNYGICEGATISLVAATTDAGEVAVDIECKRFAITSSEARLVWVEESE